MDEILLINPPQTRSLLTTQREQALSTVLPLGLAYLAAVLERDGYRVQVVDMMADDMRADALATRLRAAQPRLVGITSTIRLFNNGLRVARLVKQVVPSAAVVMGGPHASFTYEQALQKGSVDALCRFEGEQTLLELTGHYLRNDPAELSAIRGIAYPSDGHIVLTPARAFITDLDSLPFPARHLFPIEHYPGPLSIANVIVGRGCPFECIFCSANTLSGRRYRVRSAHNVLAEIVELLARYHLDEFYVVDDTFTVSRRRVKELCEGLIAAGVRASWGCEARVNTVDEELLRWLYAAGCRSIQYGAESGDDTVLAEVHKGITTEQVEAAVWAAHRIGLEVACSFVIGHPFDTRETVRKTIAFARHLIYDIGQQDGDPRVRTKFAILTPLPGTPVYDQAEELGVRILTRNWDRYSFHTPVIETRHLDRNDLASLYAEAIALQIGAGG